MKKIHKLSPTPKIVFLSSDLEGIILGHYDPIIIAKGKGVFADHVSLTDIIFQDVYDKLGLKNIDL